ncbi:TauD/TfdA family dioxygenase [Novosphingobium sp. TH158]|uniref:TauD/TfdA dioxygenase family protein n=1 Tax=Novosphingobium sp. TH158 TaxID=2067455 RepID=UPI000C7C2CF6|nr:TauD/TfdA family dioxygenase [Novosphingobium sp. TH158]PLK26723.1 taurine catabolism dioxygenase [Novosphingobium sp. TH158]
MEFETRDLSPLVGTEMLATKEQLLAGNLRQEIRELLEQRGVLLVRQLNFTDEEQFEFAKTIGEVIDQGIRGIYKITLDRSLNDTADYLHATVHWHVDGAQDMVPTRASILTARVLSKVGGQTEFANTYAAYDALPPDRKALADRLRVVHSQEYIQRAMHPDPSEEQLARWREHPEQVHPMVWTHRSGRKSLLLGLTAGRIDGMDEAEGRRIIDEFQAWATQPQFVYRHEWTVGDMLIWDNTGVMHRVEAYPADSGRLLSRTTLVGEEPIA